MEDSLIAITNNDTRKHILQVSTFVNKFVSALLYRAANHDVSKLQEPEVETFAEYTARLKDTKYGTEEYNKCLAAMKPALDHHYSTNRHHPEHFKNGIEDMNLVDLIEMFCDWKAASMRQNDGNLELSIEKNQDRFKMPRELGKIFKNTISVLE